MHSAPHIILWAVVAASASAVLPPGYQGLTDEQKQDILWDQIAAVPYSMNNLPTKSPGIFAMAKLFLPGFNTVSFTHTSDEMPSGRDKLIHIYGSSAKVELQINPDSPYTGIFQSGGIGIARLSLAKQDYKDYTPGMGLKILISGQRSQNFQVMHSVDGQGTNKNFFHQNFSNIIPPAKSFALKALSLVFAAAIEKLPGPAQNRPESESNLGLLEQASVTRDGQTVANGQAPYQVILVPNPAAGWDPAATADLRVKLDQIPQGTVLYTVTAKRTATSEATVIGQLVTASQFVASYYQDSVLFSQHASKRWQA